jgi:oligopeptide transport system ATP-binding protein
VSEDKSMSAGALPLLRISDLSVEFRTDTSTVRAVERLSFEVMPGEVVGVVGESGCGKSATSLAVMGLLPEPRGRIVGGRIEFEGQELTALGKDELRRLRGRRMAMIFQDPMTSLNPYMTVAEQLIEVPMLHRGTSEDDARKAAVELLDLVRIPRAKDRMQSYPHELSGGMCQRIMIAMALSCEPSLLFADEPTTALDVTTQAVILELLRDLQKERKLGVVLITHDLGVVAGIADKVIVMYAGRMVEQAPTRDLFSAPAHPYTRALIDSVPRVDVRMVDGARGISGLPPRLDLGPFGACTFEPRCPEARGECRAGEPALVEIGAGRKSRCILSAGGH